MLLVLGSVQGTGSCLMRQHNNSTASSSTHCTRRQVKVAFRIQDVQQDSLQHICGTIVKLLCDEVVGQEHSTLAGLIHMS